MARLHNETGISKSNIPMQSYPPQKLQKQVNKKHFHKMYRDVGMAMPKSMQTRCRDCNAKKYANKVGMIGYKPS